MTLASSTQPGCRYLVVDVRFPGSGHIAVEDEAPIAFISAAQPFGVCLVGGNLTKAHAVGASVIVTP